VRVVVITSDNPDAAQSIATHAGIAFADRVLSGTETLALSDARLATHIGEIAVLAWVVPDQKLRIVRAPLARNEVVAMTGEGVNDARAIKAAQVGIAMREHGTGVAREATRTLC
jgi:magnesium-transporting ATPase (P-type)